MPIIQEVTFQISEGPHTGVELGNLDRVQAVITKMRNNIHQRELAEFQEQRRQNKLSDLQLRTLAQMEAQQERQASLSEEKEFEFPFDEYTIEAPVIGAIRKVLGKSRTRADYGAEMLKLIMAILNAPHLMGSPAPISPEIQTIIKNSTELKENMIDELYHMLTLNYKPWESKKADALRYFAPLFNQLVSLGASFLHLKHMKDKKGRFEDLMQYVLDRNSLTTGYLAKIGGLASMSKTVKGDTDMRGFSFAQLRKTMDELLPLGANINTKVHINPQYGNFLHYYLAFEYPEAPELIAYFESKRAKEPNTQFDYSQLDGYGNTSLLLAILTRNEKAVFSLLDLNKTKRLDVGIKKKDSKGRSPLLIAASLGLTEVVKRLIQQGADVNAVDATGRTVYDYSHLNDEELHQMLIPILHPLRAETDDESSKHSYLYSNDDNFSPLCFYEDGEAVKTGAEQRNHLIVLSNCPKEKKRLDRVVQVLREQAKNGDPKAKKLLPYVLKQIERIEGKKSFLELCKKGQVRVQDYLGELKKENNEKQLREAALLGRVDVVKHLLEEGVDPNAHDRLNQTPLHHAVARFETVKMAVIAEEKKLSEEEVILKTQAALGNHHLVVQTLLKHSLLNVHAKNNYSRTAKEVLLQDLDTVEGSENRLTREEATRCLEALNEHEGESRVDFHLNLSA